MQVTPERHRRSRYGGSRLFYKLYYKIEWRRQRRRHMEKEKGITTINGFLSFTASSSTPSSKYYCLSLLSFIHFEWTTSTNKTGSKVFCLKIKIQHSSLKLLPICSISFAWKYSDSLPSQCCWCALRTFFMLVMLSYVVAFSHQLLHSILQAK